MIEHTSGMSRSGWATASSKIARARGMSPRIVSSSAYLIHVVQLEGSNSRNLLYSVRQRSNSRDYHDKQLDKIMKPQYELISNYRLIWLNDAIITLKHIFFDLRINRYNIPSRSILAPAAQVRCMTWTTWPSGTYRERGPGMNQWEKEMC